MSTIKHANTACRKGIKSFSDVMAIAEILDHPSKQYTELKAKCSPVMRSWISITIDPDHRDHDLLEDTLWRSMTMQLMHDDILDQIESGLCVTHEKSVNF